MNKKEIGKEKEVLNDKKYDQTMKSLNEGHKTASSSYNKANEIYTKARSESDNKYIESLNQDRTWHQEQLAKGNLSEEDSQYHKAEIDRINLELKEINCKKNNDLNANNLDVQDRHERAIQNHNVAIAVVAGIASGVVFKYGPQVKKVVFDSVKQIATKK